MKNCSPRKIRKVSNKQDIILYALLVAFPLIQFFVFYILVNLKSVLLIFQSVDGSTGQATFSSEALIANFTRLSTEFPIIIEAFKNSVIVWLSTMLLSTFLAIMFSYYIYNKRFLSKLFKFFLFLPSILPSILIVLVFKNFNNYFIKGLFDVVFHVDIEVMFDTANHTVLPFILIIIFSLWISFGSQVLLYTNAMSGVNDEVLEAARLDGASPTNILFSIMIPAIMPTIGTFLISGVLLLFTTQANLHSFYGVLAPSEFATLGYYMYVKSDYACMDNYPYIATLGVICTFIAIPITFGLRKFIKRWEY